jgi:serine/threonine protein kinase
VPVHDAGVLSDGRSFYVMKLVRGETLAQGYPATDSERLRLFLRICETVAFAHARGVVHCDLKPSNVMAGEFGEVLVMDWGIANGRGGTKGYMAPEQADGDITPAADVFALGTILGQMIAKSNRRMRAIISKATAASKTDRYATAAELAADISRYIDDRELAAYRESHIERLGRWMQRNRALLAVVGAYILMRVIVLIIS